MAARDVVKNFNVFVDGRGYAGQAEEVNPPKLAIKMEEFRAGGMNGTIELDMGMDKMETDVTLISFDSNILSLFGVAAGATVPFVIRKAVESFDGGVKPVTYTMRGKVKELDPGTIKAGEAAKLKISMALTYYKQEVNGVVTQEIDIPNMVHIVGGVDVLADQRAALGI